MGYEYNEVKARMKNMQRIEVPAVWLTCYDIVSHAIDELLNEEIDHGNGDGDDSQK